jgi:GNAT superfamily N-acetyltransferase
MEFRIATKEDIPWIQDVRHSVTENVLSNPGLVTDEDCEDYLTQRGRGWVCILEDEIVGFAIADLLGKNIWALFVRPEFEKKGIGKKLHKLMMDWYFSRSTETIWLSTAPGTRAADFYKKAGWRQAGLHGRGELKFEMSREDWHGLSSL